MVEEVADGVCEASKEAMSCSEGCFLGVYSVHFLGLDALDSWGVASFEIVILSCGITWILIIAGCIG